MPARAAAPGVLGAYVRGPEVLIPGTQAAVRVATHIATSASDSQPAAQVRVQATLVGSGHSQVLWTAQSDDQGRVDAHFQVPAWPPGEYALTIAAQLQSERVVQSHKVHLVPQAKILLQSDKPLYQPGQTIHLRAVAMRTQDGHPLTAASVRFEVHDARNNLVFTATAKLSAFGIAAADAVLAEGILLGTYQATARLDGAVVEEPARLAVEVSRYSLPKLKLTVQPDRPYYRPGERVKLGLDGRYFTGKPVVGGEVTVAVALQDWPAGAPPNRASTDSDLWTPEQRLATLHGKLDAAGKVTLEVELPQKMKGSEARLLLDAVVTDSAQQRQAVRQEVTVFTEPLRLDIVAEAGNLIPELPNAVYVIAAYPDGAPAVGATVELELLGQKQTGTTDAIGVATFQSAAPTEADRKQAHGVNCNSGQIGARAQVRDRAGVSRYETRCLTMANNGGLLLRTDRAIYPSGAPLTLSVLSATPGDTQAFIDVWKDEQVVDTATVPLHDGRGELTLPASERRFGTLALQAYTIRPNGVFQRDARLVYIDRPGALRVEVTPQPAGAHFAPGEKGQIKLRVVDAQSGKGVQAALGVVMVDEALLALRPLRPGLMRTYFQLAEWARAAGRDRKAQPGGYGVEKLVEEGAPDEARQRAARILLAGAQPPWRLGWELDPWESRRKAAWDQQDRIAKAVTRFSQRATLGERGAHGFHYRHDLIAVLLGAGLLDAADTRDPWRHVYTRQEILDIAALGDFADYAQHELDDRLSTLYKGLMADARAHRLAVEPGTRHLVITAADLQRIDQRSKLASFRLLDPWGNAFYLSRRPRPYTVSGLVSRYVVGSAGPDGVVGTKDDLFAMDELCGQGGCGGPIVTGKPARIAFDDSGRGACGCAAGIGGLAGSAGRRPQIVVGSAAGGIGAAADSVRSAFPETMLYLPEVITDAGGEASLEVAMADSITTWHLAAEAVAMDGHLGAASLPVRVRQDFYVDLDLPPSLTQHDELAVPVAVYNYLPTAQKVTLEVEPAPWFELLATPGAASSSTQVVAVAANQVGLGYVRLRVLGHGRQTLTVKAHGAAVHDATARATTIVPDGIEQSQSFADQLASGAASAGRGEHTLTIPSSAIAGTAQAALKLYPALLTHVIEGLDSLLELPHGCFEQTSSTTYPNALVLRYLKRTGKSTPALEKKAREYLHVGYQRLLSFEVPGGGFSLFGGTPANRILSAFGIEEFADMAQVYPVEPQVIERTQRWLAGQQEPDGSFAPDHRYELHGSADGFQADAVQVTAYIALALRHTDQKGRYGEAVRRAQDFVRRALGKTPPSDSYTLALVAELLPGESLGGRLVADALWAQHRPAPGGGAYFGTVTATPTHGRGRAALVETTAVAAQALLGSRSPDRLARVDQLIRYLISNKDPLGNFTSTQATVRTLKALLTYQEEVRGLSRGTVTVQVDGQEVARQKIDDDTVHVLALGPAGALGTHRVTLRYDGTGPLSYQLVARYYQPLAAVLQAEAAAKATEPPVQIVASVHPAGNSGAVRVGDTLHAEVTISAEQPLDIPMVTIGLPPGVEVDRAALDDGVRRRAFDKYELSAREVVLYLRRLAGGSPVSFAVPLVARMPGRVAVPQSSVYEYYLPEERVLAKPSLLVVEEARTRP